MPFARFVIAGAVLAAANFVRPTLFFFPLFAWLAVTLRGTTKPARFGLVYPVTAFATLQIRQRQGADVRAHLATVPEVLELHTTTGTGDMLCRLVARSNADLQRVIDRVVGFDGIVRASTAIVMENPVPLRIIPLVEQAALGE